MACRTCLNQDNWRPGITTVVGKALKKSFARGCKNGYTDEEIKALKDELICTIQSSESALQKYTLNVFIMILSSALHSRNYCDARINLIKDYLEGNNC